MITLTTLIKTKVDANGEVVKKKKVSKDVELSYSINSDTILPTFIDEPLYVDPGPSLCLPFFVSHSWSLTKLPSLHDGDGMYVCIHIYIQVKKRRVTLCCS